MKNYLRMTSSRSGRLKNRKGNSLVISIILIMVLMSIGVIVGGVALRDSIVQQYGDMAVALDRLDQSYAYRIEIDPDGSGPMGFMIVCEAEYNDDVSGLEDNAGEAPAGITFNAPSSREEPIDPPTTPFPYPTTP